MRDALRSFIILLFSALATQAQSTVPAVNPYPSPSPVSSSAGVKFDGVLPAEKSNPVVIPRFDAPPVIDGKLDDAIWAKANELKHFYQTQPGDNIPIRQFNQATPILFYSAAAFDSDKEEAIKAGAQVYLTKPDGVEDLLGEVDRLINASRTV